MRLSFFYEYNYPNKCELKKIGTVVGFTEKVLTQRVNIK